MAKIFLPGVRAWLLLIGTMLVALLACVPGCGLFQQATPTPTERPPQATATVLPGATSTRLMTTTPLLPTVTVPVATATPMLPTPLPRPPTATATATLTPLPPTSTPTPIPPTAIASPTPAEPVCYPSVGRPNLYSGPATAFGVVLSLGVEERVRPIARNDAGTWIQVVTIDGVQGWLQLDLARCQNVTIARLAVVNIPLPTPVPPPTPVYIPPTATATPTLVPPSPTPTSVVITEWRGEYFSNVNLAGSANLVRNDTAIAFNWGTGSPSAAIPADYFSARWTRTVYFDSGTYRFQVQVDDGVRFWFDGNLILDEWHPASTSYTRQLYVNTGQHSLRVEYFENTGGALISLSWERLPDTFPNYRGEYYNNESLLGSPALVRNDPVIDFIWGQGSPDSRVNADSFSVRWTGRPFMSAGLYRLQVESDDGVRVWINNTLVVDRWQAGSITVQVDIAIDNSSSQDFRVEYFERTGAARVHVWWLPIRGPL